jgi:hypothetical protein
MSMSRLIQQSKLVRRARISFRRCLAVRPDHSGARTLIAQNALGDRAIRQRMVSAVVVVAVIVGAFIALCSWSAMF